MPCDKDKRKQAKNFKQKKMFAFEIIYFRFFLLTILNISSYL